MIEQGEVLNESGELVSRIQSELDFRLDEAGEWYVNDEYTMSNGIDLPEWIPEIMRISKDGSWLEFGIRKKDLEKTLELARLNGSDPKDINYVRSFWPDESRFTVVEDEDFLYVGSEIEPTINGLETNYQEVSLGVELAITAASRGMTYEEMKSDKWMSGWLRQSEVHTTDSRTIIFGEKEEAVFVEQNESEYQQDLSTWARDAENLRLYPMDSSRKHIQDAPYRLQFGDISFSGTDALIAAYHRGDKDDVRVSLSWHDWNEKAEKHIFNHVALSLPIENKNEIKTVQDLEKISSMEISVSISEKDNQTLELPVSISVEDHKIVLESEEGELSLEIDEPQCGGSEKPLWQFRFPTDEENEFLSDPRQQSIVMSSTSSAGNGIYCHEFEEDEGQKEKFCIDCFPVVEERFADKYPLARRENAVAAVRAKLDELGYQDVQLLPEQTWPSNREKYDNKLGLVLFAYLEYERDGKTIMRRCGMPKIFFDGTIIPDMPSREYVEFR